MISSYSGNGVAIYINPGILTGPMTTDAPIPTEKAVNSYFLATLKHGTSMEYFMPRIKFPFMFFLQRSIGHEDRERPHDMEGPGNKYELIVWRTLALQYMEDYEEHREKYEKYIMAGREIHRQLHHHEQWNGPHPHDFRKPNPNATKDGLRVGALDTVRTKLENRPYEKKKISGYDGIEEKDFAPHQWPWIKEIKSKMQAIEQPKLELITSLHDIPNIGLPDKMYNKIIEHTKEALDLVYNELGYKL